MSAYPQDRTVALPTGLRLAYRDWGGSGRPLVLAHGLASSYTIWNLMAPRLAEHFRVVAVDQRAHGRSERPDDSFDFSTYVSDLRAFIEALGLGRSILVGHSWGGNVVVQFAVDQPALVEALVLVDGGFIEIASRAGWTWERTEQELAPPNLEGLTRVDLEQRIRNGDLARHYRPELVEAVVGHFEHLPDGRVRPWLRREHHMRILRALWEHRPSDLWARIEAPVLIVPARRPGLEGRHAELAAAKEFAVELAAQQLRRGRVLWMEDTIHDIPLQRPAELAEAIVEFAG